MENREQDNPNEISLNKDSRINLVINQPDDGDDEIDLGRVFGRMKKLRRVYAWLLLLCMLVGLCAPVALYEVTKAPLTVSSVVKLNYEVPAVDEDGNPVMENGVPKMTPVSDLTAPDGTELDLSRLMSSYVLRKAVGSLQLSKPISLSALQRNLKVDRVLSEESSRTRELIADMRENKNSSAYDRLIDMETTYAPRFVVSLTNGFGEEDSRFKTYLEDEELSLILNAVIASYNDYLVETYGSVTVPADEIGGIDITAMEPLETMDRLYEAADHLLAQGAEQTDDVRGYRSWTDGRSLNDWMAELQTVRDNQIVPLRADLIDRKLVRDPEVMLNTAVYQLSEAREELKRLNESIGVNANLLESYRNNTVTVLVQEGDAAHSTKEVTEYYNGLVSAQADLYSQVTETETRIANLENRIAALKGAAPAEIDAQTEADVKAAYDAFADLYRQISRHTEEIRSSAIATHPVVYTAPEGKPLSFLSANLKKMIIGLVLGLVVGFAAWFFSALAPEFRRDDEETSGKEAV